MFQLADNLPNLRTIIGQIKNQKHYRMNEQTNNICKHGYSAHSPTCECFKEAERMICNENDALRYERDGLLKTYNVSKEILASRNEQLEQMQSQCDEARAAMIEAKRQRDQYRSQLDGLKALLAELKNKSNHMLTELHALRANTAPEPSRLEIAARIMQGFAANPRFFYGYEAIALRTADALIAAAKEVQR